jgi:hypothetical protein
MKRYGKLALGALLLTGILIGFPACMEEHHHSDRHRVEAGVFVETCVCDDDCYTRCDSCGTCGGTCYEECDTCCD